MKSILNGRVRELWLTNSGGDIRPADRERPERETGFTGWVRIQSTGGARTFIISILACEKTSGSRAVRGVFCIYQ